MGDEMISVAQITSAKSWLDLRVPKTKTELRKLQQVFHPDVCNDPNANMAFAKLIMTAPEFRVLLGPLRMIPQSLIGRSR